MMELATGASSVTNPSTFCNTLMMSLPKSFFSRPSISLLTGAPETMFIPAAANKSDETMTLVNMMN